MSYNFYKSLRDLVAQQPNITATEAAEILNYKYYMVADAIMTVRRKRNDRPHTRDTPTDCAGMSTRATKALLGDQLDTLGKVIDHINQELYIRPRSSPRLILARIPNLGPVSIKEILDVIRPLDTPATT